MGHKKLSLNNTSSSTNFYYLLFRNMTLCSIVFLALILFVFTIPYSLAAPNAATDNVSISIPVACTMSGTVVSPHAVSTIGGMLEEDIGTTKINTACNDKNGYVVYAIGNTGDVEGSTVLSSTLGSSYDIPTGALNSDSSAWAMKLSAVPGDYAPEIMPAFTNYTNIPNVWTKVASRASGTASSLDSAFNTTYAVHTISTQPAGTYSGQVKYVMLHPSTAAEPTDTLEHAFALAGKTKVDNILNPETGEYGSFYKMQDMTTNICESTSLVDEQNTLQLVDIRDNKLYWVTKLRDGHCWMTQNLDLDLSSSVALTSETTDLNDNSLMGAYQKGYSYDVEHRIISWTPENTTRNYAANTGTPWYDSLNKAYSLDPDEWYWNGNDNTPNCNYLTTTCEDFSRAPYNNNGAHGAVGNYYNWSAVIASDDSSSLTSNTYTDITKNPQNSICPKGWRLPTVSSQGSMLGSTSEFVRLNGIYNDNVTNSDRKLIELPLWFARSGYVSGSLVSAGGIAYYWSSTIYNGNFAYRLRFTGNNVDPANNYVYPSREDYGRRYGMSTRCLAR